MRPYIGSFARVKYSLLTKMCFVHIARGNSAHDRGETISPHRDFPLTYGLPFSEKSPSRNRAPHKVQIHFVSRYILLTRSIPLTKRISLTEKIPSQSSLLENFPHSTPYVKTPSQGFTHMNLDRFEVSGKGYRSRSRSRLRITAGQDTLQKRTKGDASRYEQF